MVAVKAGLVKPTDVERMDKTALRAALEEVGDAADAEAVEKSVEGAERVRRLALCVQHASRRLRELAVAAPPVLAPAPAPGGEAEAAERAGRLEAELNELRDAMAEAMEGQARAAARRAAMWEQQA